MPGTLEAAQIAKLGGRHHGGLDLEPAEATDPIHDGLVAGCESHCLDPSVQVIAPLELVLQECEILAEHHPVLLGELARLQHLTDPVHVASGPVSAFPIEEAPATKELENIVSGLQDLAPEGLPPPDQVPQAFLLGVAFSTSAR